MVGARNSADCCCCDENETRPTDDSREGGGRVLCGSASLMQTQVSTTNSMNLIPLA